MIAKFLDIKLIKTPIVKCNAVCAFTGVLITQGVLKKDLISNTFTDYDLMRYDSNYVSVGVALLLSDVIPNGIGGFNSLRNYSFYVDALQFKILQRDEILPLLLNLPSTPFQICVTFSNKKHIAYRSKPQYNKDLIVIATDLGDITLDIRVVKELLQVLEKWYKVIENNTSKQLPTYFTKAEILGENTPSISKIKSYGITQYFEDTKFLEYHRGKMYFKLLTHILNKNEG